MTIVSPAPAGMIPRWDASSSTCTSEPRTRGDDPEQMRRNVDVTR